MSGLLSRGRAKRRILPPVALFEYGEPLQSQMPLMPETDAGADRDAQASHDARIFPPSILTRSRRNQSAWAPT